MSSSDERAKQQRANATNAKIAAASGRLRMQWSAKGNCLQHDWHQLAASAGLSSADISALQEWVRSQGLQAPMRRKPK